MPEQKKKNLLHHRGRAFQVPIYLGKQLRSFLYMNDWKMLPMAAVIAALVSMVIRRKFFVSMEGTLMGAFALTCVSIWNGCFNSIQVICRERPIIKREHRSGMHITSYIVSNMIYQALLCLGQTVVTLHVCKISGVNFPDQGFMTPWLMVDIGITIFLVTYASDMLSLLVSSIAHTTTAAMTVMPFVLIFQLVFSGSVFTLPAWAEKIGAFTISHYGLTCITAQADYNNLPMTQGWDVLVKLDDQKIEGDVTLGEIIDFAQRKDGIVETTRERTITLYSPDWFFKSVDENGVATTTDLTGLATATDLVVGTPTDIFTSSMDNLDLTTTPITCTIGELIDFAVDVSDAGLYRDKSFHYSIRVGDVLDAFDRDVLKVYVEKASSKAMYNASYARTEENIWKCWAALAGFALFFAALSVISLEFIDKDKR